MRGNLSFATIVRLLSAIIWIVSFITAVHATPLDNAVSAKNNITENTVKPAAIPITKPSWMELTPAQQQALTPLSADWDKFDAVRKKKWLEIGNKFPKMTPDEQKRVQERMREWAKLSPEQRRLARENYAHSKKLNPTQKTIQWKNYQQLPEDLKKKLADEATAKKRIVNLSASPQKVGKAIHATKPKSSVTPSSSAQEKNQVTQPTPIDPTRK